MSAPIYSSFDYCPRMVREFLDSHQGKDIERATAKEPVYRAGELAPCDALTAMYGVRKPRYAYAASREVSAVSALANCLNGDLRFFQLKKHKKYRKCSCTTTLTGFSFASGASEVLLNSVFLYLLFAWIVNARQKPNEVLEPCQWKWSWVYPEERYACLPLSAEL